MKKTILIIAIFSGLMSGIAQRPNGTKPEGGREGGGKEKIMQMKENFLRENLALTEQESLKFWPVYHQNQEKILLNRKRMNLIGQNLKLNLDIMTEPEAEKALNDHLALEEEMIRLRKAYLSQLKEVITPKKIVKLQMLERDFQKNMLKKVAGKVNDN